MVLPLIDKTYTIADAAEDTDRLTIDETHERVDFNFQDEFSTSVARALIIDVKGDQKSYAFGSLTPDSAEVTGGVEIVGTAIIDSAYLDIDVDNSSNSFTAYVTLTTTDLYDPISFSPYRFYLEVPPNTRYSKTYLILNASFIPPAYNGKSYLRYTVEPQGGSADESVPVRFDLCDLDFKTLPGIFSSVEVAFKNVSFDVPIPEEVEGFRIGDALFTVIFTEQLGIPVQFVFHIEGDSFRSGSAGPIDVAATLKAAPLSGTRIDTLQFGDDDIVNFINSQPEHIVISGNLKIGDGSFTTIHEEDSLKGIFVFETPLIFGIDETVNYSEVDVIHLDEDAIDSIRDNLIELSITNVITNHLPVGASVALYFSNTRKDSTLYENPDLIIGPIELAAATLSASDPAVLLEPGAATWTQTFTKDQEIAVFEHKTIYYGLVYHFLGTEDKLVQIRPSDYIHVHTVGSVTLRTEIPEDDKSEGGAS